MDITSFVVSLKPYLSKGKFLAPHLYEEYTHEGALDRKYVEVVMESRTTQAKFNNLVKSELGSLKFESSSDIDLEFMGAEEFFKEHYIFGKYPNVRGWIGHIYRVTGKLLPKSTLFEALT